MRKRDAAGGICDVCQGSYSSLQQLTEDALVVVAEASGLSPQGDYCEDCVKVLRRRLKILEGSQSQDRDGYPTLETVDGSLIPSQEGPRLSEMPLPISPARSRTSSSQQSELEDTVDRLVNKKRRVDKSAVGLASQSLSLDNASSQNISASQRHPVAGENRRGSTVHTN